VELNRSIGILEPVKRKRSAAEWVVILNRLAEALPQDHLHRVTVIGGAAMILGYGARRMTDDVDAVMTPEVAAEVIPVAMAIAPEFNLDPQWLNQQAMAAALILAPKSVDRTVFATRSLVLEAPPVEHMLAMKITAYRSYKDWDDAALLLKRMERSGLSSVEDVWNVIGGFVPVAKRMDAQYNLDDLWDRVHGTRTS
jgi:Nucleotidyltransferase of unknown function (DUF6036)